MEYSTVQYILLEADHQSDSELTFDEIQTTLQNMKISRKKSFETNSKKSGKSQDPLSNIQEDHVSLMKDKSSLNEDTGEFESYMSSLSTSDRTCTSISENDRQRLIDTLTDFSSTTATTPQTPLKVKRSRKQQLISVDRDDGEIIIQPASILNEELTSKKRTTRRRQLSSQIRVTVTNTKRIKQTKQIKRMKRRKVNVLQGKKTIDKLELSRSWNFQLLNLQPWIFVIHHPIVAIFLWIVFVQLSSFNDCACYNTISNFAIRSCKIKYWSFSKKDKR